MTNKGRPIPYKTPQAKRAEECPFNCQPIMVMSMAPPIGHVANAYSRCHHCNAYWITDSKGNITSLTRPINVPHCPICLGPWEYDAGNKHWIPQEQHVCPKK